MTKAGIRMGDWDILEVDFNGEVDPPRADISKYYWMVDHDSGEFMYTVKNIAEKLALTINKVSRLAFPIGYGRCECSSYARVYNSRSELTNDFITDPLMCPACMEKLRARQDREREEQRRKLHIQLEAQSIEAWDAGRHEALTPLELNFLAAAVQESDRATACKKIGISRGTGNEIYRKFEDLHLIYYIDKHGYIPDKYFQMLKSLQYKTAVKSIFGSTKAHELYRYLKRDHLYVYPEIPLAAFVDSSHIEHLFTEKWHRPYFLACRMDFVVCEKPDGIPSFVVEYQGGYHSDRKQEGRDQFKRTILEAVGIAMREVTHSDLRGFKRGEE